MLRSCRVRHVDEGLLAFVVAGVDAVTRLDASKYVVTRVVMTLLAPSTAASSEASVWTSPGAISAPSSFEPRDLGGISGGANGKHAPPSRAAPSARQTLGAQHPGCSNDSDLLTYPRSLATAVMSAVIWGIQDSMETGGALRV